MRYSESEVAKRKAENTVRRNAVTSDILRAIHERQSNRTDEEKAAAVGQGYNKLSGGSKTDIRLSDIRVGEAV